MVNGHQALFAVVEFPAHLEEELFLFLLFLFGGGCVVDFVAVLPHGVHHLPELGNHLGCPDISSVLSSDSSEVLLLKGCECLRKSS